MTSCLDKLFSTSYNRIGILIKLRGDFSMIKIKKVFGLIKRKWYLVVILLAVAGILYFKIQSANNGTGKETPFKVKRQNLTETLSISGKIDATESASLRFQTSGMLAWVGVKEGDTVKKYQTVASLDKREIKQRLDKYLNSYLDTRWDFEQTKDDNNRVLTTAVKRVLDQSQFTLNNAVLDVEIQNLALLFANLWTPIDGIVTKINSPQPGVNITPATAEFQIINPQSIYFSALADQTDVVKLKTSKEGVIIFDSYLDKEIKGTIFSISFTPKSGETGTVYEVKVSLPVDNSDYHYRMGMTGDIDFVVREKKNVLAVPYNMIKTESGKKYVLKQEGKSKVKTFITLGEEMDDLVEIKEGISEGDVIY